MKKRNKKCNITCHTTKEKYADPHVRTLYSNVLQTTPIPKMAAVRWMIITVHREPKNKLKRIIKNKSISTTATDTNKF